MGPCGLAVLAVGLTAWGVSALVEAVRDDGAASLEIKFAVSQILIFIAFMFGFVLVMTAAFFGSPAISTDLESGVAQAMLARPLRRSSTSWVDGWGWRPSSSPTRSSAGSSRSGRSGSCPATCHRPVLPILYLAGQALVLLSLTVLLSTRLPPIAGGAIAVVAYAGLT